ncbi:MAG TPA: hypothetical protein P5123_05915 [Spirochaetota bacterium]|nr:hypothetical protein [Spirochaetota bacterium]
MTVVLAVADDRFRKRPSIYRNFSTHAQIFAKKNRVKSCCIFFSRDRRVPEEILNSFDNVITADNRFLNGQTDPLPLFQSILDSYKPLVIMSLHHDFLVQYMTQSLIRDFSAVYDVCDIRLEDGEQIMYQPLFRFRYYRKKVMRPGMMIFVRACPSDTEAPAQNIAKVDHFAFRFPKEVQQVCFKNIENNYSIVAGRGLIDNKYFTRYIVSIGDKMKGAALCTESLRGSDDAVPAANMAETCAILETDFSVFAGEEGNYDLLEKIQCQKYSVYINNCSCSPLLLVSDDIIIEETSRFIEIYNKKLRKVSFTPKKINKKLR